MTLYQCSICGKTHSSEDSPCPQTLPIPSLDEFMAPMPILQRQWHSYLKWGRQGPPHGALVTSIVSGFGNTGGGVVMKVTGPVFQRDGDAQPKFIGLRALQLRRCGYTPYEPGRSLCDYEAWWTKIVEADAGEKATRDYWPDALDTFTVSRERTGAA